MTTPPADSLIHHVRRVALRDDDTTTDARLLEQYLRLTDADAFAALVRRHGPMVRGVCRRVLRDEHDAEDAFQATFLVLVRKAASVSPRTAVATWLYGVAYRTALKARTAIARRRARERRAAVPGRVAEVAAAGQDVLALVDRELNRLPEKYRTVVVVCDLEGKSRKEAAGQLGWPEGTVAGRLVRARALLARRLSRYGITAPAAAAAVVSAGENAPVDSRGLSGGGSVRARALAAAVLRSMRVTKLVAKAVAFIALLGATTLSGATVAFSEPPEKGQAVATPSTPVWPPVPTAEELVRYLNESSEGVRSLDCFLVTLDCKRDRQSIGIHANFSCRETGKYRLVGMIAGQECLDVGCNDRECWYRCKQDRSCRLHSFVLWDLNPKDDTYALPVRPEWLLESLGLAKLDPATPREVVARAKTYELVEKTETVQGEPAFKVTVFARAAAAVQVPERVLRDARGRTLCRATVRSVFPFESTGKTLPGEVEWEFPDGKLTVRATLDRKRVLPAHADEKMERGRFRCPLDESARPAGPAREAVPPALPGAPPRGARTT